MESVIPKTMDKLVKFFEDFNLRVVACDTETTGLRYYQYEPVGISLCDGNKACYIDLKFFNEYELLHYLIKVFSRIDNLVFHHANFDINVLYKFGIKKITPKIFDTMVAAHLLDENGLCGLKDLAHRMLGENPISFREASKNGQRTKEFYQYACNDAIWTWRIFKIFDPLLYEKRIDRLFFECEMPFQFILALLNRTGVTLDVAGAIDLRKELITEIDELKIKLYEMVDVGYTVQEGLFGGRTVESAFNLGSSDQLVPKFQNMGIKLTEKTKTGKYSLDHEALQKIKHPVADKLLRYRKLLKIVDTFIDPALSLVDGDYRLRSSFKNNTVTGRLSSSKINLQQLPNKRDKEDIPLRKIYKASEGYTMVSFDFSGQELCGLAHCANDPNLIKMIKDNIDIHLYTANEVLKLNIPKDHLVKTHPEYNKTKKKYKVERYKGKNGMVFPVIYGRGPRAISEEFGVSEGEAQNWIDSFLSMFPEVKKFVKKTGWELKSNKFVKAITGRRRHLDPKFPKSYRQAVNFKIQSLGADMLRMACNKVLSKLNEDFELDNIRFLMVVHDEIVFECKEGLVDKFIPAIKEEMENSLKLSVPLEVECKTGKNYQEAK